MQTLAFLNLGASEMILILLVLLVLFGADKAPQLARSLGKARAQMDHARGQLTQALRTEEERLFDEQTSFERERERQVMESDPERAELVSAAEALGLQTQGLSVGELKAAIKARLSRAEPPAGRDV